MKHLNSKLRRRAFTLVELLLVLVILATLAAIVIPNIAGRSQDARLTAAKTQISAFESAIDAFEVDNGRYPEEIDELFEEPADAANWRQYLKKAPPNDPWGAPYVYVAPGDHNTRTYDLYSMGPDGKEGGGDDVVNWTTED